MKQEAAQPYKLTRILILEDNPGDLFLVQKQLAQLKPSPENVDKASLMKEAIEAVQTHQYDVILADLSLPDIEGVDTVRRLQVAAPASAIIVLSGNSNESIALEAVGLGAQDYLIKDEVNARILGRTLRYAVERKRAERYLSQLTHYDQLTELVNLATFRDRLTHSLARVRGNHAQIALMYLDLDGFRRINDTLGYGAGDLLLQNLAKRMQQATHDFDTVGRLGSDEFVILMEDLENTRDFRSMVDRILKEVGHEFKLPGHPAVQLTASAGVAVFPHAGSTDDDLLTQACLAMKKARAEGGNACFFSNESNGPVATKKKASSVPVLRKPISIETLAIQYRPRKNLSTGDIVCIEASLGTKDSRSSEEKLLRNLKAQGLLLDAEMHVFESVCKEHAARNTEGVKASLQLSRGQFLREDLIVHIRNLLSKSQLPASAIELRVPESIFCREHKRARSVLAGLRAMGMTVAVDNFGTGNASFLCLRSLFVDVVKVDPSIIRGIGGRKGNEKVIASIAKFGHDLDFQVVAGGVDSSAQLGVVKACGYDAITGDLAGHPKHSWRISPSSQNKTAYRHNRKSTDKSLKDGTWNDFGWAAIG